MEPRLRPAGGSIDSRLILAALEQTRASACITTADLDSPGPRIVYVNPAYCSMTGRRREDVIGRTPRIMQGPLTERAVLDRLRSDLEAGRPFAGETVNYRADGSPFLISWQIDAVRDGSGKTTHFVATQTDVTEQRRAADLLAAQRIVDIALAGGDREPGLDVERVMEAVVSGAATIARYGRIALDLETTVADRREHHVMGTVLPEDPAVALVGASLRGRLAVSGLDDAERRFVPQRELETFAIGAARALDAACEYQNRRYVALTLQDALLPAPSSSVASWSIAARYVPGSDLAAVGGDWYDVVEMRPDTAAVVVGDVSGSGVRAAATMGRLRAFVAAALEGGSDPAETLALVDRDADDRGVLATALIIVAGPSTITVASAGHPPPLVVRADGGVETVALRPAPPVGFGARGRAGVSVADVADGDVVVAYTDGLVERRRTGLDQRLDLLSTEADRAPREPAAMVEHLLDRLVGADGADDDCVVIALQRCAHVGGGC